VASIPRIKARCEIDLSPGTRSFPRNLKLGWADAGVIDTRIYTSYLNDWKNGFDSDAGTWQATPPRIFMRLIVSKSDAGTKQTCPECAAKFYDLNKRPAVCPKCEHSYNPDAGTKTAKKREPEPATEAPADADETEDTDAKPANEADVEIEGLDAEEEEAKSLELDGDNPVIGTGGDGDDEDADADAPDAAAALPEGFTEEGVEDDADALADTEDEEIDLDVDLDES